MTTEPPTGAELIEAEPVITHTIVRMHDGKPTSLQRGEIPVLCMWLLRQGAKDAAESLATLKKWNAREFVPLGYPNVFARKACDCTDIWNGWWFWSDVDGVK